VNWESYFRLCRSECRALTSMPFLNLWSHLQDRQASLMHLRIRSAEVIYPLMRCWVLGPPSC
jgi:hypothetical protein